MNWTDDELSGGDLQAIAVARLLLNLTINSKLETWFIHGALNGRTHAMRDLVEKMADLNHNIHVYFCYSELAAEDLKSCDQTGLITAEWLETYSAAP